MASVQVQRSHTSALSAMNIIGAVIVIGLIALYASQLRRRRRNGMLPFVRQSQEIDDAAPQEHFNENDFLLPPRPKGEPEEPRDERNSNT